MKLKIITFAACVFLSAIAFGSSKKIITLKDGSVIKGYVTSVEKGLYTIQTENIGDLLIDDERIVSIASEETASNPLPLKQNVQSIQGQIMGDEAIMGSIQTLTENQEIMKILQDPELMKTIMTFDEEQIRNNPSIQQLLQREDVRQIMGEIQQKLDEN